VPPDRTAFVVAPAERVGGKLTVPGDKSISHRALMLGAIAQGTTRVSGFLRGEDCLATLKAFAALGVPIRDGADGELEIDGRGLDGLQPAAGALDFGNSGTAIRLMTGLLAAQRFDSVLTGDRSLRSRPMERVAGPLRRMGAQVATEHGTAPIRITGGPVLHGIDYTLPVPSAQIKSALLLAALYAHGRTTLHSPGPSRDHTERMLKGMGVAVQQSADGQTVGLEGPARLRAAELTIPGDFSSAAFFLVAGCLAADGGLLIENVGVNPTRTGLLDVLAAMGARIERRNERLLGAEPVADLYVERSLLHGLDVPAEAVPLAIDEFPALFVAAAAARGRTVVRGADELRHKESDRLAVMAAALRTLGAPVEEFADGLAIDGGRLRGGRVDSGGDHRVAMALAVAALISDAPVEVADTAAVATSFPEFVDTAERCGLRIESAPFGED
jgi:3-phosphoshikimate 1-carboxyvinyltransferase